MSIILLHATGANDEEGTWVPQGGALVNGEAVVAASDGKYTRPSSVADFDRDNSTLHYVNAGVDPADTGFSIVVHIVHRYNNVSGCTSLGVGFNDVHSNIASDYFAYDQNPVDANFSSLPGSAFTEYTKTFTENPTTGDPWTYDDLFTANAFSRYSSFFFSYQDGGHNATNYHIDEVFLEIVPAPGSWWLLALEILDGLQYRFNLVRNWYRYQLASPGSGWTLASTPAPFGVFQSTDGFTGAATIITGGLPANPRSFAEISAFATGATETLGGSPGLGVVFDNMLIYPAKTYTVGTDLPPIRIFDGISDREFVRLPKTASGAVPKAVLSMLVANGTIYVSTLDSGSSSADWAGRVFALNVIDGTLTIVGDDAFASGQLPYALAWHAGMLWVGTHRQSFTAKGALYRIRPELDNATWTKDADLAVNSSVCSLLSYAGKLYIGTMYAAGTFAKVLVRDYAGVYTTSDTGSGGTARAGNGYLALCEFGGNLYAAFWNNDTSAVAKIRKFDGSTWSTVYSTLAKPFALLFVENSSLYAYSVGLSVAAALVTSEDGAAWTDLTAQLVGSSQGLPLVGVVVR